MKTFESILSLLLVLSSVAAYSDSTLVNSTRDFANYTAISDFRVVNRRFLYSCPSLNPFITITVTPDSHLPNDGFVTVTIDGIMFPSKHDWVAMVTPSHQDVEACPFNKLEYAQTGDLTDLPLLCHYPIKAQHLRNDPNYLNCRWSCSATLSFHVVNVRTDIEFVLFGFGYKVPCVRRKSNPIHFANPKAPLHGHISSVDSTSTSMKLTWVSGDRVPQYIQFWNTTTPQLGGVNTTAPSNATVGGWNTTVPWNVTIGGGTTTTVASQVKTFKQNDMCTSAVKSPAEDFGWHDPGFVHSAVMMELQPLTTYTYRYGSDAVGWSENIQFRTPPASGADALNFISFGDYGKTPRDQSDEHYIQPGAVYVTEALKEEVASGNFDSIFHIGDISYATGFMVEWDFFLHQISPYASKISYMTAIGNHERDYVDSGSPYITPDSGGECGVPYETYFPMPVAGKDKPWYSIEQGPVHFTVISSEHDYNLHSEQHTWIVSDLASVNRSRTPWVIFMSHRPFYSSVDHLFVTSSEAFGLDIEPLLLEYKVDLALGAHVHNYERTCAVYQGQCISMPFKDRNGIDTYNTGKYTAPVHALIGMAGFVLDLFQPDNTNSWSLVRISEYGYARFNVTRTDLMAEFVNSQSRQVRDRFRITKNPI